MEEPRRFDEIATHARIVQEELAIAMGAGYIRSTTDPDESGIHPSLPGFARRSKGSRDLRTFREVPRHDELDVAYDHIRFLEQALERLAAQLAEMAERLDESSL